MKSSLSRVAAPTQPVITIEEAREQLRVDAYGSPPSHPEDALIMSYVEAITESLDAGTGWLGRALSPQTWQMSMPYLSGSCRVNLPYPPLIEVVSFTYTNAEGATITLAEGTDYRLVQGEGFAYLVPPYNATWPVNVRDDYDSVKVTFRCGYAAGSPEQSAVPEIVKRYVKAALTEAYDNRDVYDNAVVKKGEMTDRIPNTLNMLRVYNQ